MRRLALALEFALALAASPLTAQTPDTLTLADALDAALRRSPALAAVAAGASAAEAGRAEARAAWLPSIGTSGTVTRFAEPMVVAPLHGFDPRNPPEFDRTLAQGRVSVGWTLFDGGSRSARVSAATARMEAAGGASADARAETSLALLDAYLRVLGARDAKALQGARERQLEEERARAERLVGGGAAPRLDLLRAEAELEAARAAGIGVDAALTVAEADLGRRMGIAPARIAAATLLPVRAVPGEDTLTVAPTDHPAVRQARARAAAGRALVREARSAWLPRIQGTGAVVEYGRADGGFTGEWQAGLQVDYALFAGGARSARIDQARAESRRADAEVAAAEEAVLRGVDQARAAVVETEARARALASTVARFEELTRVEALALSEGADVQAEYLRALATLFGARAGEADARRAVVAAHARLARAEGRLDEAWIRRRLEIER